MQIVITEADNKELYVLSYTNWQEELEATYILTPEELGEKLTSLMPFKPKDVKDILRVVK